MGSVQGGIVPDQCQRPNRFGGQERSGKIDDAESADRRTAALVGNRFAQRRLHGRLPAATDEGGRHDHAVRRNRIGLFGSDRTRTRNRATEPGDRRADGLRKRGVRKAAAPVERCDRPLSHSRRDEPRGGGRKDAARTGLPTKRLRTGDQRVQRRMADAHRTGKAAASPAVGIPARRTHESPRHREHRMARKLPEGVQRRGRADFARPRIPR